MNNFHKKRLFFIMLLVIGLASGTALILFALKKNMNVFLTPEQLFSQTLAPDYHIRLGGMVKNNSLKRAATGLENTFIVTDFKKEISVHYQGILPDLFREGKGVIVEGTFERNSFFKATRVLAKHDENYMPVAVYEKLRQNSPVASKA